MWNLLLDIFFPRRSLQGTEGTLVTTKELEALMGLAPVIVPQSELRLKGMRYLDRLVGASTFKNPLLRRAIHLFKYRRILHVSSALAHLLVDASRSIDSFAPVLCPVPLHWSRRFWRGFNQSQLLASFLSAACGWEYEELLIRERRTGSQVGRGRGERQQAMKDAFAARHRCPRHVVLIDDVFTTGATMDQCAKALKAAGAEKVEGLVVAID